MKREELLNSPDWWLATIQNNLYRVISQYMKEKKLNKTEVAKMLRVTKGYVTQVLNGDFDHRMSSFIKLSMEVAKKIPIVEFVDIDKFIDNDSKGIKYKLVPFYLNNENLLPNNSFTQTISLNDRTPQPGISNFAKAKPQISGTSFSTKLKVA
jgi:predicted XRE-type DNA-binding protein